MGVYGGNSKIIVNGDICIVSISVWFVAENKYLPSVKVTLKTLLITVVR
jgi:hypothetical protein